MPVLLIKHFILVFKSLPDISTLRHLVANELAYSNNCKMISVFQHIGDDISTKSSNVKININDVCNLISVSSKQFN
jgi:hypothetical protein